jgi:hypothetical protein
MIQISENSIYTNAASKKEFLADKQRVIDAFLINFLGQVGLYQHGKKAKLVASLKADDNVRLNAITDEHKDLAVTLKAAFQIGAIKLANGNRFTKFILELKQGKLQSEDVTDAAVRQLLKGINFKAFLPSQKMKVILNDFVDGGTLSAAVKAIYQLVKVNKQYTQLGQEFMELARQYVGVLGDDAQPADEPVSAGSAFGDTEHIPAAPVFQKQDPKEGPIDTNEGNLYDIVTARDAKARAKDFGFDFDIKAHAEEFARRLLAASNVNRYAASVLGHALSGAILKHKLADLALLVLLQAAQQYDYQNAAQAEADAKDLDPKLKEIAKGATVWGMTLADAQGIVERNFPKMATNEHFITTMMPAVDRVFGVKVDAEELKTAIALNNTPKSDIAKEIFGAAGSKAYEVARKYGIDLTVKAASSAVVDWFEQNKPEVVQNISINNWLKGMGKAMIAAGDARSWFIGWLIAGQESVRANLPHPIETLAEAFAKQPQLITGAQGVFGKDVTAMTRYVAGVVKKVVIDGLQGQYGTDNFLPRSEDSVQTFDQYAKAGYDLNAILPSDQWFRLAVLVAANKQVGTSTYHEAIKAVGVKQRQDGEKIIIDVTDAPEKFKVSFADYIEAGVIKQCGTNVAFELPKSKPEITEADIVDMLSGTKRPDIDLAENKETVLSLVKTWIERAGSKMPRGATSSEIGLWIKAVATELYSFLTLVNLYTVAAAKNGTGILEAAIEAYQPSDKLPILKWNGFGAVDMFISIRESISSHLSSVVAAVPVDQMQDFVRNNTNFLKLVERKGINTVDGLVGALIKTQPTNRRLVLLNALRDVYKGADALFMALAKRIDLKVSVVGDQIQIEDSEDIADIRDYLRPPVVVLSKDKENARALTDDDARKIVNATGETFDREVERLGLKDNEIAGAFIRWLDSASKARIDSIRRYAAFTITNPMIKKLVALGDVGVQAVLLFNIKESGFAAINTIVHLIPSGRISKFEPWFDAKGVRADAIRSVVFMMLEGGASDGTQYYYGDAAGKLFKRLDDKIGLDASKIPDSSPRRMMAFYDVVPNESMGDAIKTKLTKMGYGVRFEEKKLVIDVSKDEFTLIDYFKLLTGGNVVPELTVDYGKVQTAFEILFSDARSSEEIEYLKGVFDYAELGKIKDSLETAIAGRDVIKDLYNWMSKGGVSVPLKIASIVEEQIVKLIPNKIEKFGDGKLALKFYSRMVDREYGLNFVRMFGTIFSRIDIDFLREVFLNNLASPDDVVREMVEIFASAGVTHRTVIDWMKEANVPTKIIMGKISKSPLAIAALTVEEKKEVYGTIEDETYQTMFLSHCGDDIAKVVDEDEMVRLATADHFGHVIPAARVIYDALPPNRRAECIERMVTDTSHLKGQNLNRAFLFDQTYTLEVIQRIGSADFAAKYSTFFGIDTIVAALPSSFVDGVLNNEDKIKQYSEILLETGGEGPAQVAAYINKHHDVIAYVGLLKAAILLYGIDVVRLVDNNLIEESLGLIAKDVALSKVLMSIKDDPSGIKPLYNLSPTDVKNIIRFNDLPAPKALKRKVGESPIEYLNRIKAPTLERIAVEAMPDDAETLARQSIEYHRFNSGKHGKIFVTFLKSYNYNAKNIEAFEQFRNDLSERGVDNNVFEHAFHGTGSAVAPMILRNGFKVIKSKEGIKAGRMLGDGIYFSNVLDKVASYVGDMNTNNNGYGRRYGTRGYIFEMDALLGVRGEDYQSAGVSGATSGVSVISPEWCVVDPNKQLLIKKVHLVEITSMKELDRIAAKLGSGMIGENVMEIKTFKQHIANKAPSIKASYIFVFRDGKIPLLDGTAVSYEDFEETANIKKYMTQYGPAVEMTGEGLDEPRYFDVLSTTAFLADPTSANFYAEAIRKSI